MKAFKKAISEGYQYDILKLTVKAIICSIQVRHNLHMCMH
jgi:hypothetical protein